MLVLGWEYYAITILLFYPWDIGKLRRKISEVQCRKFAQNNEY
jgi:hypothetical protein